MDLQSISLSDIVASAVTALGATGASFLVFRRRLSKDNVEMAKDRAEENTMKLLQFERDKAIEDREKIIERLRLVDEQKTELTGKIYQLSGQVEHLNNQIESMRTLIEDLGSKLDKTQDQLKIYIAENAALNARINMFRQTNPDHPDLQHDPLPGVPR